MNTSTQNIKAWPLQSYVRTPEDEENDRIERAWKNARDQQCVRDFLRTSPDGRAIPVN